MDKYSNKKAIITTYTKPIFKTICKNGSLKYGCNLVSIIGYSDCRIKITVNIYGKTQEDAEIKFYKAIGKDAILQEEQK
jgi:hypothetical protein